MADTSSTFTLPDWPMFGWTSDVRQALSEMISHGATGVLATLYAVVGGAPRPAGAQLLITEGEMHGFLSGGCIEGDIAAHAIAVLSTGRPERLVYGDGGPFSDIRLVCGGRVDILLERIPADDVATNALIQAYHDRRPALWASDGRLRLCTLEEDPPKPASGALAGGLNALRSHPQAACANVAEGEAVALRYRPARRLIVVGHDPTALAIASLAAQSGFETYLVRPKGPALGPPLPGVAYHRQDAADALRAIGLDAWTYVAVATHEIEADEEALIAALPSQAAYVGVLGARRRLPDRLVRLRQAGLSPEAIARMHAPIGLDIGGKAPFEVAVSVMAEVMAEAHRMHPDLILDIGEAEAQAA